MLPSTPSRSRLRLVLPLLLLTVTAAPARAADRAVVLSGDWSSTLTWSGGVVPTTSDNAFVGSSFPAGALTTATVNLSQNVTAGDVYLGRTAGTSGTLELGNFTLTADVLFFGYQGSGSITRGTGHLDLNGFDIRSGNTFTLASTDIVRNNLTVLSGSTLTLSSNLSLTGTINLADAGTVLNAQGFNIAATNQILLGWNGPGAQLVNRGTLTTNRLNVRGQHFDLTPTDAVGHFVMRAGTTNLASGVVVERLDLTENAIGTTVETGNITGTVLVDGGSTLSLGAALNLSNALNIQDPGTVLNANGHNISAANQILLGWDGTGAQLVNRGTLTTARLNVRGQNFDLTPTDDVDYLVMRAGTTNLASGVVVDRLDLMENAIGTTVETGNITGTVLVDGGSTLSLGAALNLSNALNIQDPGTVLDANGHNISAANQILLGWDGTGAQLVNRGTLTTARLNVRGQDFDLTPTDAVGHFVMRAGTTNLGNGVVIGRLDLTESAIGTTTQTGNITGTVLVEGGSALTLGANLSLSDSLNIRGVDTVLNANTHNITATNQILIGWDGGNPALLNRGNLTTSNLRVRDQNFQLTPTDSVLNFELVNCGTSLGTGVAIERLTLGSNATASTSQTANISKSVSLHTGGVLTLNDDLSLTEFIGIADAGTVLNANGHSISNSGQLLLGFVGTGAPVLQNFHRLNVGEIIQGNGTELSLASGEDTAGRIVLGGNSRLISTVSAAGTGLTLTRPEFTELIIDPGSHLTLSTNGSSAGWAFRWANPAGGDHVAALNDLISQGRIDFTFQGGFTVQSNPDGFTYILVPVPEPASVLGICAAVVGVGVGARRWRNRRIDRV